jgi:hypothetical protein
MASDDDSDGQVRTDNFDGSDEASTSRNPANVAQTDIIARLEWLVNQCMRSNAINAELSNQLKIQEAIIRNLQTVMMPNMDFNQIMGGLIENKSVQIMKSIYIKQSRFTLKPFHSGTAGPISMIFEL